MILKFFNHTKQKLKLFLYIEAERSIELGNFEKTSEEITLPDKDCRVQRVVVSIYRGEDSK